ncbi:glutamate receptor ionotropic, kainate 2-like [Penaeus chinensis]|uniref:glutamate receptor ionotropic, kainate 2-like n=1 Tax=Penaeus chinensis TaxID=139456 RepID=UPI001FB77343|nr:glutamate receptor ionotropic, kainate 2-like [Penaeus chinensis]
MAKDLWMASWVMTSLVGILASATSSEAVLVKQQESEASLSLLLVALAEEEALRECLLVVVADESFRESRALTEVLKRPNLRQTEPPGQYRVYMNQLYWGPGMALATTWRRSGFTRRAALFPDKTSDLRGAELKVVQFELPPHIIYERGAGGLLARRFGRDVEVVRALAKVFGFRPAFVEPPPGQLWGDRLPNGSWDGIVDVLYTGKADIGVGNMYVSDLHDRMDFQHYSAPYAVERSCFTAKMEPPVPRWRSLVLPYQTETWLAFLAALAVCACVIYLLFFLTRFSGGSDEHRSLLTAASSFLYAAGMHFRQPQHRVPAKDSTRSFFILLWFYAIVLTTSYSSNLTAFLTKSRQPKGMETIRELREANLPILCVNSFFKGSMVLSENKDIQALADRYRVVPGFERVYKLVLAGEGVNIESRSYLEYVVSTQFTTPQGSPRMRIMKECISVSHIAMGFQIYSPLKAKFSKVIMWMVEGGLVTNWFFEAIERAKKIQEAEKSKMKGNGNPVEEESEARSDDAIALSIDHMQSIFYLLILGYLASVFVFLIEVIRR